MIKHWKYRGTKPLLTHPRITLTEDEVELPSGKIINYVRQVYSGSGGVVIVCLSDGKLLVQREYSYPVNEVLYQFPGGKIEEGETPVAAASRELAEESGVNACEFNYVGWFYADNRRTDAKLHIVFSDSEIKNTATKPDDTEFIESEWMTIATLNELLSTAKINNYAMLAALAILTVKYPNIFKNE